MCMAVPSLSMEDGLSKTKLQIEDVLKVNVQSGDVLAMFIDGSLENANKAQLRMDEIFNPKGEKVIIFNSDLVRLQVIRTENENTTP